ncbi:uncharacterized protein TRIADDRAFT_59353 [Trichoplax adhaerens]|uniref:G-protein coupled receptors family 2 profile 2 domain-containing protein n=1 Tax=Trichoplax adhaerens TaxID=10228 RepID=B3S4U8_TRIAD|nr:hypothetical protein TRIADDRAFT_59353 [Trichoplax adhaerens]EDV22272.1 hypothetical protein TRIADDRAFT_59353 [Trichoplax adhaerens]|eukprot:XP_002115427.1 hypothetical protein TRIADDRAFT_59353 [Trichoplax adhaerens]
MVIKTLISIRAVSSRSDTYKIKTSARAVLVLMPIFGLSWLFGLLAMGDRSLIFSYIFVITNSLQGVFIFKFHCLNNKDVVRYFSRILRTKRTRGSIASQLAANREQEARPVAGPSNKSCSREATFSQGKFSSPIVNTNTQQTDLAITEIK